MTRVSAWAGIVVLVLALLSALAWGPGAGRPHQVPVGVVAPEVASDVFVRPSTGFEAPTTFQLVESRADAVAAVRRGDLVAAVVMDLSRTRDEVLLDRSRDADLLTSVLASLTEQQNRVGRTLTVSYLESTRTGSAERVDRYVLLTSLAGFLLGMAAVIARWVRRRPIRRVPRVAIVLLNGSVLLASAGAVVAHLQGGLPIWPTALVLLVVALTSALLPVAFAVASELRGLGVALLLHLTLLLPLVLHLDSLMMAQPWSWFYDYTMPGAARAALTHVANPASGTWPPIWTLLSLTAWWVASSVVGLYGLRESRHRATAVPLLRGALSAVPAVVVLIASAMLLPTDAHIAAPGETQATTTRCVHLGKLEGIDALNAATRSVRGGDLFGGGDIGASTLLQDGRSLWMFGDSVRKAGKYPTFVRNSMLLFDANCLAMVLPSGNGAVIPTRKGDVGFWPMSILTEARTGYDVVTVTAQRVRGTGTGIFDFEILGPSAAVFVVPVGGTPQLMTVRDLRTTEHDDTRPMWGAATAVADGWTYLYGTAQSAEPFVFGYSLRVARVRTPQVLKTKAWKYWDGHGWSDTESDAVELIPAVNGASQTLSVWPGEDGTWYALSKRNDYLGSDLVVWTAPGPTGPFTAHPAVAQIPSDVDAGLLRYMPLAHPEIQPVKGTVVVSYSNNRSRAEEVRQDPRIYRPTFLRVPLPTP